MASITRRLEQLEEKRRIMRAARVLELQERWEHLFQPFSNQQLDQIAAGVLVPDNVVELRSETGAILRELRALGAIGEVFDVELPPAIYDDLC